jgi:cardiolipin synthase
MRRFGLCILLLLLIPHLSAFEIIEFCPDTYLKGEDDEYIRLAGSGCLDGVRIGDGEGSVRFPDGTFSTGDITIARTADSYSTTFGVPPDFEIYDTSAKVPDMIRTGDLRMANTGDELILMVDGITLQRVEWPADVCTREGQIHFLGEKGWDPRPLLIGQSRFAPATFDDVTVIAFVAPDCSSRVMNGVIGRATERILVNVYEFTDPGIADAMSAAAGRGVDVRVLLEGGPVGGISMEEYAVVNELRGAGADVSVMTTTGEAHARYRFDHAKYIVIDSEGVLITSENFKPGGFPPEGGRGNRGWGAYLESAGLAGYFERVFLADTTGGDIVPAEIRDQSDDCSETDRYDPEFASATFFGARATPVLSPDTSSLILELLAGATATIDIEQAYIQNWSGNRPNPYIDAAIDAARRGVRVRVLLDSYWYNTNEDCDNDEMVAWLNRVAEREQLPLEARCADLDANNLEKIHNKGVIVDERRTLVSSINWNENSPSFNREAGIIIDHPDVAAYYTGAFEDDWSAGSGMMEETDEIKKWSAAAGVVVIMLLLYLRKRFR